MGGGTSLQGLVESITDFATRALALGATAEQAFAAGAPGTLDTALEEARKSLAAIERNLPLE